LPKAKNDKLQVIPPPDKEDSERGLGIENFALNYGKKYNLFDAI